MNKRSIEIVVSPDGAVIISAFGFEGKSCLEATGFLEDALGEIEQTRMKPEYNQGRCARRQQKVGQ